MELINKHDLIKEIEELFRTDDPWSPPSAGKTDVVDAIQNASTVMKWMSVKEGLPENSGFVLVCTSNYFNNSRINVGYYTDEGEWIFSDFSTEMDVTHWMPLPPLPNEEVEIAFIIRGKVFKG